MKSILAELRGCFEQALADAFGEAARGTDPLLRPSADPKFGDYQSNVAMGLAKRLGRKPREVAEQIVAALGRMPVESDRAGGGAFADLCEPPEIAGPGFINLRLRRSFLEAGLNRIPPPPAQIPPTPNRPMHTPLPTDPAFDRLGVERVPDTERDTVVIDYSSPNVAKQMHVGHLRSTIIGDTIARVLELEGHEVVRQNHVGDWGTQFGIILEEIYERGLIPRTLIPPYHVYMGQLPQDPEELEAIYRAGNAKMADEGFASRAREAVARLQGGSESEYQAWMWITYESMRGVAVLYRRLGVSLNEERRGESFYNPLLPGIVEELRAALTGKPGTLPLPDGRGSGPSLRAVCRDDQGAVCVFLEQPDGSPAFKGPQGDPLPMLIQKSDGAFLYATTDLAAVLYRVIHPTRQPLKLHSAALAAAIDELGGGLGATRILYVVGAPQKLHFEMLFAVVRALGWTRPGDGNREVRLEHVAFGSVLGEDRKMLRTRSGESVKLKDLLEEAVQRAEKLVRDTEADPDKRRGFTEDEIQRIAEVVGISAVKYADLCQNRHTDYVFSWDKMLALQGNTAPYLLYAYARIRSIHRKGAATAGGETAAGEPPGPVALAHPTERALALAILRLPETIDAVADSLLPSLLCEYLYDLAGKFMSFYESCPVLQAAEAATAASRLRLCELAARTLKLGLSLLGIPTLDRM